MHYLPDLLLLTYAAIVAAVDSFRHRIPNTLTVPAAAIGALVETLVHGAPGLLASGEGVLLGLALFLPMYLLGGTGAGDVKALAAAGSFLGPQGVLVAAICTLILGGLGGTIVLLAAGGFSALQSMVGRWTMRAFVLCTTGRMPGIQPDPGDAARLRFPYGLAIACGLAASVCLR